MVFMEHCSCQIFKAGVWAATAKGQRLGFVLLENPMPLYGPVSDFAKIKFCFASAKSG